MDNKPPHQRLLSTNTKVLQKNSVYFVQVTRGILNNYIFALMIPIRLLVIRFLQIFRALIRIPLHALIILGTMAFICKLLFGFSTSVKNSILIGFVVLLLALTIQFYRNDKRFVFKHLVWPQWQMYTEYAFFSTFFLAGTLFTRHWYIYPIVQIGLIFISWWQVQTHYKTTLKNLSRWIPSINFEILSGVRRSYVLLWPAYVAAYVFCWVKFLPLFIIWFINIQFAGYFGENESLQMVTANGESSWSFIGKKIFRNLLFITLIFAPITALQYYFFPEIRLIILLFMGVQYLLLIFSILYKYALFEPSAPTLNNSILLAVVSMFALLPYSLPILLVINLWFIKRAYQNLKTYLS